ncbi:hypothetical protein HPB51_011118 [Rhipicephalus microplus]|uniref:Uncharacterized protein n=1 Tax=Rhipicephalus microplus TaxID=6941 RepID=A0A9J6E1J9_RHIMP|nr:hypothetical protein HPB51_011118 [Rhipicephalus microplus]
MPRRMRGEIEAVAWEEDKSESGVVGQRAPRRRHVVSPASLYSARGGGVRPTCGVLWFRCTGVLWLSRCSRQTELDRRITTVEVARALCFTEQSRRTAKRRLRRERGDHLLQLPALIGRRIAAPRLRVYSVRNAPGRDTLTVSAPLELPTGRPEWRRSDLLQPPAVRTPITGIAQPSLRNRRRKARAGSGLSLQRPGSAPRVCRLDRRVRVGPRAGIFLKATPAPPASRDEGPPSPAASWFFQGRWRYSHGGEAGSGSAGCFVRNALN